MARPTLATHPKFAKLAARLASRAIARGVLELIWEAGYAEGNPQLGDAEAVEAVADWRGARGELAAHLVASGFLDVDVEGNHQIHDLVDHAPDYVARRMARAEERARKGTTISEIRAAARRGQTSTNDDKRISFVTNVDPPAPAPAPAPAHKKRSDPSGGPASAGQARSQRLIAVWCEEWDRKFGQRYVPTGPDAGKVAQVAKTWRDEDDWRANVRAYLLRPMWGNKKHSLWDFAMAPNGHTVVGRDASRSKTAGNVDMLRDWMENKEEAK